MLFRSGSSDRVQLLYHDQEGQVVHPLLSRYLVNALIPEEEAMYVCIYGVRCVGNLPQLSIWLVDDFKKDDKQGKVSNFYSLINSLNRSGEFPMSGIVSQLFNQMGMGKSQSVDLIRLMDHDSAKRQPVVFFRNGLMVIVKPQHGVWRVCGD